MTDIWLIYDWYMNDIWMIYDWYMTDIWPIYDWYMTDADAVTPSSNTRSYTLRSVSSSPGRSFLYYIYILSHTPDPGPNWNHKLVSQKRGFRYLSLILFFIYCQITISMDILIVTGLCDPNTNTNTNLCSFYARVDWFVWPQSTAN